jgi:hypothetical protein
MLTSGPVFRETPTSLFQADPVSNHQFFANFKKVSLEPERLLMLAVLEDAIKCVEKYAKVKSERNRKAFDETIDWIRTQNDEWLFSFDNVCDALDFNAGRLRDALLQMVVGRRRIRTAEQSLPTPLFSQRKERARSPLSRMDYAAARWAQKRRSASTFRGEPSKSMTSSKQCSSPWKRYASKGRISISLMPGPSV